MPSMSCRVRLQHSAGHLTTLRRNDPSPVPSPIHKLVGDRRCRMQQPAGVAPQVQHQRLAPLLAQRRQRLLHMLVRIFRKLSHPNIAHVRLRIDQVGPRTRLRATPSLHRSHPNIPAGHLHVERFLQSATSNRQRHRRPGATHDLLDQLRHRAILRRFAVHAQNLIAGLQSRLVRRRPQ